MSNHFRLIMIFGTCQIFFAGPAMAYIGPGAGLGAIAVTVAMLLGVLLLVIGLVWYPLKRFLKRRGDAAAKDGEASNVE